MCSRAGLSLSLVIGVWEVVVTKCDQPLRSAHACSVETLEAVLVAASVAECGQVVVFEVESCHLESRLATEHTSYQSPYYS